MSQATWSRPSSILVCVAVVVAAICAVPVSGHALGARFFAALRIAKPKPVAAATPGATAGGGRQLDNVVAGILAETTTVALDEPDAPAPSADSAARAAGFRPQLIGARHDSVSIQTLGARRTTVRVNRAQLLTLFAEAGRPAQVAPSLDGATVTLSRPRGVRVQYGNCPAPIANTLQNQIQGPPPPSTDNGNCVMLDETPLADVNVPAGLDTAAVMDIALELGGMSPDQVHDFRSLFGWREALALSAPRGIRSYQMTSVNGTPAMLMLTAARRGPTYSLIWVRNGTVYTMAGYGSSGDAVSLAESAAQ